jgi:hypothetical protein
MSKLERIVNEAEEKGYEVIIQQRSWGLERRMVGGWSVIGEFGWDYDDEEIYEAASVLWCNYDEEDGICTIEVCGLDI